MKEGRTRREEGHKGRKDTRQGKIERDATGPNGRIVYQYYYFFLFARCITPSSHS
jgi:hypothetical protein